MPDRVKIESSEWVVEKEGTIADLSAAVTLSTLFTSAARPPVKAVIQAFSQAVRYTIDGTTTPSATVGFQFAALAYLTLTEPDEIAKCKLIEAAGSATAHYVFYNRRDVK